MRNSKTVNLFESIQHNSIADVIDKVAEQFKSEIIEEYKTSETKDMSTELESKIISALANEGVDSPEDWVADVCYEALDMTPTGEALAIDEGENVDIKEQLKQLGIKSIYVSSEHKRADGDELNKLNGLEFNNRLERNPDKAHFYGYLSVEHETLGVFYVSFDTKTNEIDTTGFPWHFIEDAMTSEIKEFVETNKNFFDNLLKSKTLGSGINLEELKEPKFAKPINEDYSGLDDEEKEAMIKRVEEATGYDLEECTRIVEDGDYVWFSGVDNEKDLGKAYVDMIGISGVGHIEQYIDEDKVKEEIKEFLDNEGEEYTEAELNAAVDIDIQDAISIGDEKYLERNFDYEALGRDLHIEEYYFIEDGCIGIFN